jgi:hypothetical protein
VDESEVPGKELRPGIEVSRGAVPRPKYVGAVVGSRNRYGGQRRYPACVVEMDISHPGSECGRGRGALSNPGDSGAPGSTPAFGRGKGNGCTIELLRRVREQQRRCGVQLMLWSVNSLGARQANQEELWPMSECQDFGGGKAMDLAETAIVKGKMLGYRTGSFPCSSPTYTNALPRSTTAERACKTSGARTVPVRSRIRSTANSGVSCS